MLRWQTWPVIRNPTRLIDFYQTSKLGLASMTFKKKEKLKSMLKAAIEEPDAMDSSDNLNEGMVIAMSYIKNAASDIMV
jgi:hypothetical protein